MRRNRPLATLVLLWFAGSSVGCANFDRSSLGQILTTGPLDSETVAAGLKEALRVGTDRTVVTTSKTDGFFGNSLIRIPLPQSVQPMTRAMRTIGLGGTVDEFELAMNRAAEKAAGEATDVFWAEIKRMTIQDAMGILNGGDTAATEYFRARTSEELRGRFQPIVLEKMSEVGIYRTYDQLVQAYTALPLTEKPAFNMNDYVTERALGGLFTVLGTEEKKIRDDPAARTTELLRRVFGRSSVS